MARTDSNRLAVDATGERKAIPDGLWSKCPQCKGITYVRELQRNSKVCPLCQFHYPMSGEERAEWFVDAESFVAIGKRTTAFMGSGQVGGREAAFAVFDVESVGSQFPLRAYDELATLASTAVERRLPVVVFCAGGAPSEASDAMSAGAVRLFKALDALDAAGLPMLLVITDVDESNEPLPFAPFADVIVTETARPFADRADFQAPRTDTRQRLERLLAFAAPKDDNGKRPTR